MKKGITITNNNVGEVFGEVKKKLRDIINKRK